MYIYKLETEEKVDTHHRAFMYDVHNVTNTPSLRDSYTADGWKVRLPQQCLLRVSLSS